MSCPIEGYHETHGGEITITLSDLFHNVSFNETKYNQITIELLHSDGSSDIIKTNHTYNSQQIDWYREGSALNLIKKGA